MFYENTHEITLGGKTAILPTGIVGRIGKCWSAGAFYEKGVLKHIRSLKLRGRYVDIGMNNGNHSLFFAKMCGSTQVISFEPYPEHIDKAAELFCLNNVRRKVRVFNCALGSKPDTVKLAIRGDEINVPVMMLDALFLKDVKIIKIDVEGAEYSVLKGAEETIKREKPHLFVEIFDHTFEQTSEYICGLGYSVGRKFKSPTYEFTPIVE